MVKETVGIVGFGVGILGVAECPLGDHDCCVFGLGWWLGRGFCLGGLWKLTISMPSYQLSSVQRWGIPVGTLQ